MPPTMPKWWDVKKAAEVEKFVAGSHTTVFPMLTFYHGNKSAPFITAATTFNGNEQAWINAYFQKKKGSTTFGGPGIYVTSSLDETTAYGANVMKIEYPSLANLRYIDITDKSPKTRVNYKTDTWSVAEQDVLGYAYKCVIRYTKDYYVVKDHRVTYEPH